MLSYSTAHRTVTVLGFEDKVQVNNKLRVVVTIRVELQPLVLPSEVTWRPSSLLLPFPVLATSLSFVIECVVT